MARRKRSRRHSVLGLVKFEEADPAAWADSMDRRLFQLAARMRVAEQALHAAMDELAQAEQRLSAQTKQKRPAWYAAAEGKEKQAGAALETIYRQIAETPAHTKVGLALKLQLVAMLYGENLDEGGDDTDIVSILLRSLITDVTDG